MLGHVLYFDRAESTQPHMEGNMGDFYTFFFQNGEQFRSEMQSGSRSGCRTVMFGINRLVTVLSFQLVGKLRGKRHLSKHIKDFFENSIVGKSD